MIGRKSYMMSTTLSDKELKDATALVEDVIRDTGGMAADRERFLAVACLELARRLLSIGKRVDEILAGAAGKTQEGN
ncbi:MAG: hypothetical protein LBE65_03580 [Synergistaceae bacterium]|jgi:hypothetical protein|nr:hypothetical protein [Synergistaceae bacterium]